METLAPAPGLRGEFLTFIQTYNLIGVAIGLLIATKVADFTKSIVADVITPLIFTPLFKKLKIDKLADLSYKGILYGKALSVFIDFIITAFLVFLMIRYLNIALK
jgi:large conductance mechanosensitive channel